MCGIPGSVKDLKILMCKLLKGSFVFVDFLVSCCMWSDVSFLYFYHCWIMERKSTPTDKQINYVWAIWAVTLYKITCYSKNLNFVLSYSFSASYIASGQFSCNPAFGKS